MRLRRLARGARLAAKAHAAPVRRCRCPMSCSGAVCVGQRQPASRCCRGGVASQAHAVAAQRRRAWTGATRRPMRARARRCRRAPRGPAPTRSSGPATRGARCRRAASCSRRAQAAERSALGHWPTQSGAGRQHVRRRGRNPGGPAVRSVAVQAAGVLRARSPSAEAGGQRSRPVQAAGQRRLRRGCLAPPVSTATALPDQIRAARIGEQQALAASPRRPRWRASRPARTPPGADQQRRRSADDAPSAAPALRDFSPQAMLGRSVDSRPCRWPPSVGLSRPRASLRLQLAPITTRPPSAARPIVPL